MAPLSYPSTPRSLTRVNILGVFKNYITDLSSISDRDSLESGVYRISGSHPSWWFNNTDAGGLVIVFAPRGNYKSLIYIEFNSGNIYNTNYNWTEWTAWKKITATSV